MASAFEYEQGVNKLAMDDARTAGDNQYARFLSARNYGRQDTDFQRQFRQTQPQFGAHFAGRGMLNSGVYKSGLQNRFREYQDVRTRLAENEMANQSQLANQGAMAGQDRIGALLQLFEKFQADRATDDPFKNLQNPFELVRY
jgi:hypothetical protein